MYSLTFRVRDMLP